MLTTKKQLTAALAALVRLAPRRAEFWGVVVVTDDTMTAALAHEAAAVTVSGEQEKNASTLGVWELAPGWKAAAEMVKKYPRELVALELNESGVLCIQGAELARRPLSMDLDAARLRVDELRPAHELARAALDTAESEQNAAYNALQEYGVKLFPGSGWATSERKRRPLTTDEERRRAELNAAHDAARGAVTAARNEFTAINSDLNAAGDMVRHIERLQAAQAFADSVAGKLAQPAASVGAKDVKPLAQLAANFEGAGDGFRHVWAKDGTLTASDGYAMGSAATSGEDIPGAWSGAGLLDMVSIAGAKNSVSLHADGWASCAPQRGASVLARIAPSAEDVGKMPNFASATAGAEVVGQFAIHAGHGQRLAKLAKLFEEVAVGAGGVFFVSDHASGRESWDDPYNPMGVCELSGDIAHVFAGQGLALLKLGGRFELLKPAAKGAYMLRRAECGTVAVGKREMPKDMAAVMASYEVPAPMPSLLAAVPAEEVPSAAPAEPEPVSGPAEDMPSAEAQAPEVVGTQDEQPAVMVEPEPARAEQPAPAEMVEPEPVPVVHGVQMVPEVASAPAEPEPASVAAEQGAPVEMVEPTPAPQEKPRYRLHLDGTFEHLSGPALDVPEHRRYQPSAAPVSAEVPASVSGSPEPVSVPSVAPMSAPTIRTKRRAPVRPVRGVVACHEFSGPGVAA